MRNRSLLKLAALAAVTAPALLGAARPAAAQALPDTKAPPIVTIRGGVYLPFNTRAKNDVGKTWYGGGVDYTFQQTPGVARTNVSLDYIERNSGGNTVRIVPLTVSQITLQNPEGTVRPYFGVGGGAYFIHQSVPNTIGVQENTNATAIGGFFVAGLDLPGNVMVEGRYHIISKVGSVNSGGLQLTAGVRF